MKTISSLLLTLLLSVTASAGLLTTEGTAEKIEKASVFPSASATIEGAATKMTSIGTGLRQKKLVFVSFKVYVAQLFVSNPESFKKNEAEALGSLKDQKAVAIQLHFLRGVDAPDVQKSFLQSLEKNKVDTKSEPTKQFLDAVNKGGKAIDGKTLTILGAKLKDGSEVIYYENSGGEVSEVKGAAGLINSIFSIWLGTPVDDEVATLKKSILK